VEKLLKDRMTMPEPMSVKWFGSKDLLVPTPPNVNEPRNRRVEILVL
jgi:outer membrane protein OmpA-like peptidoglycan-associated protein